MLKRFDNYRWILLHFWNGTSWEIQLTWIPSSKQMYTAVLKRRTYFNMGLKAQINIAIHYTQQPGDHTLLQLTEGIQSWTSALNTWTTSNFRKNWQNQLHGNSCSKSLSDSSYSIVLDSVCVHSILDSSHCTIIKLIIIKIELWVEVHWPNNFCDILDMRFHFSSYSLHKFFR